MNKKMKISSMEQICWDLDGELISVLCSGSERSILWFGVVSFCSPHLFILKPLQPHGFYEGHEQQDFHILKTCNHILNKLKLEKKKNVKDIEGNVKECNIS